MNQAVEDAIQRDLASGPMTREKLGELNCYPARNAWLFNLIDEMIALGDLVSIGCGCERHDWSCTVGLTR